MPYSISDEPDTLLYREQVKQWMEDHWGERSHPCPVCEQDDWEAEARTFFIPRLPPYVGLFRSAFPIRCKVCSYMHWVNAKSAGVLEAGFPDDLSGLGVPPQGGD